MVGLVLAGVVDRVEGPWSVIEWAPSAVLTDVATDLLPTPVREGDRIFLRVQPDPSGDALVRGEGTHQVLLTPRGRIHLPSDAHLSPAGRYSARFRRTLETPRSPGRAHPQPGTHEQGSLDTRSQRGGRVRFSRHQPCPQ